MAANVLRLLDPLRADAIGKIIYYMLKRFLQLSGKEKLMTILFALLFCRILQIFLCSVWARVGFTDVFLVNDIIIVLLALLSINLWGGRIRIEGFIAVPLLIALYYISALIYPGSSKYVEDHSENFIRALLYLWVGLTIDIDRLKESLHLFCRIAVVGFFFYITFMSQLAHNAVDLEDENMYLAYLALPATLYVIGKCLESYNIIDVILSIVGTFLIISMGSRGPMVCIVLFVGAYLLFFKQFKYNKTIKSVIVGFASIFYFFSSQIALFLAGIVSVMGLSTRVFDSVLEGAIMDIENSSGRDVIWTEILTAIQRNPTGYGLGGDERVTSTGFYAHNVILAIFVSFGVVVGSIIMIFIFLYMIKALRRSTTTMQRQFLLLLFVVGFVKLLISVEFIDDPFFFMLIGYSIALSRQKPSLVK